MSSRTALRARGGLRSDPGAYRCMPIGTGRQPAGGPIGSDRAFGEQRDGELRSYAGQDEITETACRGVRRGSQNDV